MSFFPGDVVDVAATQATQLMIKEVEDGPPGYSIVTYTWPLGIIIFVL